MPIHDELRNELARLLGNSEYWLKRLASGDTFGKHERARVSELLQRIETVYDLPAAGDEDQGDDEVSDEGVPAASPPSDPLSAE